MNNDIICEIAKNNITLWCKFKIASKDFYNFSNNFNNKSNLIKSFKFDNKSDIKKILFKYIFKRDTDAFFKSQPNVFFKSKVKLKMSDEVFDSKFFIVETEERFNLCKTMIELKYGINRSLQRITIKDKISKITIPFANDTNETYSNFRKNNFDEWHSSILLYYLIPDEYLFLWNQYKELLN